MKTHNAVKAARGRVACLLGIALLLTCVLGLSKVAKGDYFKTLNVLSMGWFNYHLPSTANNSLDYLYGLGAFLGPEATPQWASSLGTLPWEKVGKQAASSAGDVIVEGNVDMRNMHTSACGPVVIGLHICRLRSDLQYNEGDPCTALGSWFDICDHIQWLEREVDFCGQQLPYVDTVPLRYALAPAMASPGVISYHYSVSSQVWHPEVGYGFNEDKWGCFKVHWE